MPALISIVERDPDGLGAPLSGDGDVRLRRLLGRIRMVPAGMWSSSCRWPGVSNVCSTVIPSFPLVCRSLALGEPRDAVAPPTTTLLLLFLLQAAHDRADEP